MGLLTEIQRIFGYQFNRNEPAYLTKDPVANDSISMIDRDSESTAAPIASTTVQSGIYLDIMGTVKTEAELVTKYRDMVSHPEVDNAVEEIVNEAIATEDDFQVKLDLSKIPMLDDKSKEILMEKHQEVLNLLDYRAKCYHIFRRWYVDGRLYYHAVIDPKKPNEGIKELRYIDPRKIREVKEMAQKPIGVGGSSMNMPASVSVTKANYFFYNEKGFTNIARGQLQSTGPLATSSIKISKDSIVFVPSGLTDTSGTIGLGYLQKAMRVLTQLKTMEDSLIIYRLARAPERRVWYVYTGNAPRAKADQIIQNVMTMQKNRLIYDSSTGAIQDSRKFMCFSLDTKIPLLDGRTLELQEIIKEFGEGKENWVYSADPITGKFVPGPVQWAGITKKNTEVVKVTFDNGKSIICTPDHKFPVWNKGLMEAQHLSIGESLIPGYRRMKEIGGKGTKEYEQIFKNDTKTWEFTHREVANWKEENNISSRFTYLDDSETKSVNHHVDFNRFNNSPDNIVKMGFFDHYNYHSAIGKSNLEKIRTADFYSKRSGNIVWKENLSKAAKARDPWVKTWKIFTPLGEELIIENLNQFCRENDLNRSNIKYKSSKGYRAEQLHNHKVVSVEWLDEKIDTGCLTIDLDETYHSHHTFLLDAGVYTKNTMLEDYWLPVGANGQGTKVDTLPGGKTLGEIDDIVYFQKLLYNSMNVPIDRLMDDTPFQAGNPEEINRAEIKFNKFICRLQAQFALLFKEILKKQMVLQQLMSLEEFELIEKLIEYEFAKDNHFSELKDQLITKSRIEAYMGMLESGVIGTYYSNAWVRRNIFQQNEEDIAKMTMEIIAELQNPLYQQLRPGEEPPEEPEEQQQQEMPPPPPEMPAPTNQDKAAMAIKAISAINKDHRGGHDNRFLRQAASLAMKSNPEDSDKQQLSKAKAKSEAKEASKPQGE